MKHEYFECQCMSSEHRLVFNIDDQDKDCPPDLYADMYLRTWHNFFKRIWIGIKYVFGYKCKYGHFDCIIFRPEDAPRLQLLFKEYIEKHNKWLKELKK